MQSRLVEEKSMGRMIDADAFRRELDHYWPFIREEQSKHGMADFAKSAVLMVLNQMPTIEQRKTGKWIPDNTNMYEMRFVCSSCKESQVVPTIFYKPIWGWCPNCGAKMEKQL